jgi:hypothetical protein
MCWVDSTSAICAANFLPCNTLCQQPPLCQQPALEPLPWLAGAPIGAKQLLPDVTPTRVIRYYVPLLALVWCPGDGMGGLIQLTDSARYSAHTRYTLQQWQVWWFYFFFYLLFNKVFF